MSVFNIWPLAITNAKHVDDFNITLYYCILLYLLVSILHQAISLLRASVVLYLHL